MWVNDAWRECRWFSVIKWRKASCHVIQNDSPPYWLMEIVLKASRTLGLCATESVFCFVFLMVGYICVFAFQMIEDVLGEGPVSASRFSQWFSSNMSPSGSRSSSLRSTPHEELEKLAGEWLHSNTVSYCFRNVSGSHCGVATWSDSLRSCNLNFDCNLICSDFFLFFVASFFFWHINLSLFL